jgi:hypothetical protein
MITAASGELGAALRQETEVEATECKKRCPVRFGTLRGTIHASGPEQQGMMIYCEISAGGPAAPYALIVHEDLSAHHDVGQAKYIESVVFESAPYIMARVAKRIDFNKFSGA